jgi:hypothetical protein
MKYELANDLSIEVNGVRLFRIRALERFSDVEIGDLGGYIENLDNLNLYGDAWVYGSALVYGNAQVSGNALACVNAHEALVAELAAVKAQRSALIAAVTVAYKLMDGKRELEAYQTLGAILHEVAK